MDQSMLCASIQSSNIQSIKFSVGLQVLVNNLLANLLLPQIISKGDNLARTIRLLVDSIEHLLEIPLFLRMVDNSQVSTFESYDRY